MFYEDIVRFNPLQVQTKPGTLIQTIELIICFNPLQVQTKRNAESPILLGFLRFNPLQVQTKLSLGSGGIKEIFVSIPYRYKQNFLESSASSDMSSRFNPLQVQTKRGQRGFRNLHFASFQSPIGTNKTAHGDIVYCRAVEFQSPIGTNKTV